MKIGVIGCGFVADFYLKTLPHYPELTVAGVTDRNPEQARRFGTFYRVPVYNSTADLLADDRIDIVLNLTNPREHCAVSCDILNSGKHVYSEKPLAMEFAQAEALVETAEQRGLHIAAAPCSVLGEAAQTVWALLRCRAIGPVRLVYAELDNGMVHRMGYTDWRSPSGTPWPYQDEFEVGCTLEHAAYYVSWLAAFFGPARQVSACTACVVPNKQPAASACAPDVSVGCVEFASGVVARITNSAVAPRDHRLRIIGDEGVITVENGWFYNSPVLLTRPSRASWTHAVLRRLPAWARPDDTVTRAVPLVRRPHPAGYDGGSSHQMDFARGVADLAAAIHEGRDPRLSSRFGLHVHEIVSCLSDPQAMGAPRPLATGCPPMLPMPWAIAASKHARAFGVLHEDPAA